METASFLTFEVVMSIIDDSDCEALIARLVGLPSSPDRVSFRHVVEEALAWAGPCWGEDAAYRAVSALQRRKNDLLRTPCGDAGDLDTSRKNRSVKKRQIDVDGRP